MGVSQRITDILRRPGRSFALSALLLSGAPAWAAPAQLVSHVPGAPATTGDRGLGGANRYYAMASDSGDVVFAAAASNLVPGQVDANGNNLDVYHWNRSSDTITLVSHAHFSTNTTCSGGLSIVVPGGISADGRYVVYTSTCTDLDPLLPSHGDGSAYLWDSDTNASVLLSQDEFSPGVFTELSGLFPVISADGSTIYYRRLNHPLLFGFRGELVDRATLNKTLVTHVAGSSTPADGAMDPRNRALSADGRYVVYSSAATDLVAGQIDDGSGLENLFIYDRVTDTSQLVTHAAGNPLQPATSLVGKFDAGLGRIAFAANGSRLAYSSASSNLVAGFSDGNSAGESDLYVYNRASQVNTLVSHISGNATQSGNGEALLPAINADGSRIAYTAASTNLIAGQIASAGYSSAVFLWSAADNSNRMVSHDHASPVTDAGGVSWWPAIDDAGSTVAYASTGTTMIDGLVDDDAGIDIFLWSEASDSTRLASRNAGSALTTDNGFDNPGTEDYPLIDAAGALVLFPSNGIDLVPGQSDTNTDADLFVYQHIVPTISFDTATSSVSEDGLHISIPVLLSDLSDVDVTVPFTLSGTAALTDDYSLLFPSPLVIPAGGLGAVIDLYPVDDALDENNETVVITLGTPDYATLDVPAEHVLTIIDNDPLPDVSFALATSSVDEGANANIVVQLSTASGRNVIVPFFVSGGSASSPTDYSLLTATPLTIPAGSTSATILVGTVDDGVAEPNETLTLSLNAPTNANLTAPSSHTLTIADSNDPVVRFATVSSIAGESDGILNVIVELSGASVSDVSVPFSISGSATAPVDYTMITTSPITIPAGSTSGVIEVSIVDDTLDEPDETVILSLGTPTNATLGTPSVHTITVSDDDDPPELRFDSDASTVGEGSRALVVLRLSAPSGYSISAPFSLGGNAALGDDYEVESPSPIVIPAGATTAFIDINTFADDLLEGAEELLLTLDPPVNATLGQPASHALSIVESAAPPALRFAAAASAVGEGGSAQIGVTLSAPTAEPVQVNWSVSGGTATAGEDFNPAEGTLTIPPGETTAVITVATVTDGLAEGDETAVLALGTPANATVAAPAMHTLTIGDADPLPQATFEFATLSLREGESAALTVNLSAPAAYDFIVPFGIGGSAIRDLDYAIGDSPLVIPAGSTQASLAVTTYDDDLAEGNEELTITLQDGSLAKASQSLVITLIDGAPQVNFVNTQVFLSEGFETEIEVRLDAPLDEDAVVVFEVTSVHGEPGASANDYEISGSPIMIPAGETRGFIRFLALPDDRIEVDECLLIRLQVSVNSVPGARSDILLVIRNVGGTPERGGGAFGGGALLFVAALVCGRRRILIGVALVAAAQGAAAVPPQLVYPGGRNWLYTGDDFVLRADPPAEGETLLLELDAIDVTALMQRDESGALILRPARTLAPGPHKLRLLRLTTAGELAELGTWDIDLRRSESLRSARLGYAGALQGNAPAASSEDIDKYNDYTVNAGLRLDVQADTGVMVYGGHADVLTNSNALRTGQDDVQLGDFRFDAGDGELHVAAGHHAVAPVGGQAQGNFAYDGGSRRGLSVSSKLPFMDATATAYAMGAEPVLGFRDGLGFSRPGSRFTGGMFQALPYAGARGQVGLTMHYIEGRTRYGGSSVYSADENLFIPVSGIDGSVGNAVLDTRWLDGALSLRAEYARSDRNLPTVFGIALGPITDDAQSYVLSYQTREGLRIGDHALMGSIALDRQVIGSAFRSVAAPGGAADVAQDRISAGLQYRTLSLDLSAARSEDNVGDAPFPTTRADNLGAQLSWSPEIAPGILPFFLQQPSLSLGAGSDHRKTVRLPDDGFSLPTDAENRNLTATLSFVQPLGGWSLSYGRSGSDDNTGQSQGFRGDTGSVDASFQFGTRVSMNAQVYSDLSRQLELASPPDAEFAFLYPGTSQRSLSGTLGLQWRVTDRWSMSAGYNSNRSRAGDDTQETRGQQFDLNSSWALASLNLFLRGSWQQATDRTLIQPWEDEFGETPPPEYERSRRETYQAFAGFSYNFSGPKP